MDYQNLSEVVLKYSSPARDERIELLKEEMEFKSEKDE